MILAEWLFANTVKDVRHGARSLAAGPLRTARHRPVAPHAPPPPHVLGGHRPSGAIRRHHGVPGRSWMTPRRRKRRAAVSPPARSPRDRRRTRAPSGRNHRRVRRDSRGPGRRAGPDRPRRGPLLRPRGGRSARRGTGGGKSAVYGVRAAVEPSRSRRVVKVRVAPRTQALTSRRLSPRTSPVGAPTHPWPQLLRHHSQTRAWLAQHVSRCEGSRRLVRPRLLSSQLLPRCIAAATRPNRSLLSSPGAVPSQTSQPRFAPSICDLLSRVRDPFERADEQRNGLIKIVRTKQPGDPPIDPSASRPSRRYAVAGWF
jgi:hypothetical protein